MKDRQKRLILHESLPKVMWKLSLPAIAAMVLFGLNAFMDTVYIGQLMNETALGGVALAYPLTGILLGIGSWAGTGAANLLSIALGADDRDTQQKILANCSWLLLMTTVIFAIPAYVFAEPLIRMMGGAGDVLNYGVTYFRITLLAAPLWVYGLALNMIIRGEGKMKTAAIMMSYGLGLNILLTPIFISQFDMGVSGAAWATNIGMGVYSVVSFWYFKKGKASFEAKVSSLTYDKSTFQSVLKMGFPGFIMTVMGLIQSLVVFNAITGVGTDDDLAFFSAASRILLFLMTPLFGLMRALQPVVGIQFGAGQYDRLKQSFILFTKTGFLLVAPFWLFLTVWPETAMGLVLPDYTISSEEILSLQIYMLVLPMLPLVFMALTLFPAIDQPKYASILGLARQLVFYVPVMLLLPRYFGIKWVYYGSTAIDVIITLWILALVVRLFKQLNATTQTLQTA